MGEWNKNTGCSFTTELNKYSAVVEQDSLSYYSDEYSVDSEREIEISDLEYGEDEVEKQTQEHENKNIYSTPLQFIPFSLIQTRRRLAQVNATWNDPSNFIDSENRTYKVAFRPESELVSVINFSVDTSTAEDTEGNDSVTEDLPKEKWQDDRILLRSSGPKNITDPPRVDSPDDYQNEEFSSVTVGETCGHKRYFQPVDCMNNVNDQKMYTKIGLHAKGSIENLLYKSSPDRNNIMERKVEKSTKFQSENSEVDACAPEIIKRKRLPKPKIISSPRYSEDSKTRFLQMVAKHNGKNSSDQCPTNTSDNITIPPSIQLAQKQTREKRVDTPRLPKKNSEIVPTNNNTHEFAAPKQDLDRKKSTDKDILRIFTKKSLKQLSTLEQGSDLLPGIRAQVVSQNISVRMMSSIFNDEFVSLIYNVEPVKSKWATKPGNPMFERNAKSTENLIPERAVTPKSVQENQIFERNAKNAKSIPVRAQTPKSVQEEGPIFERRSTNQNSVAGKQGFESERRIKEIVNFPRTLSSPIISGKTETNERKKGSLVQRIAKTNHKVLVLPSSARKEKSPMQLDLLLPMKRPLTR